MQTIKDFSWLELETSDITELRRRSRLEGLQKLDCVTSTYGQTDRSGDLFRSQHSVQTHERTYQSTLAMRKTTFDILKAQRFKPIEERLVVI